MKNYSLKATVFIVAALFSLFSLAQDEVASEKRASSARAMNCSKDFNQWGHSSHCQCSLDGFKYSKKTGRCSLPGQENDGKYPLSTRNRRKPLEGCEGGEFSYDKKRLSCPDGRVYKEVNDTFGGISRVAAEGAKDSILSDSEQEASPESVATNER